MAELMPVSLIEISSTFRDLFAAAKSIYDDTLARPDAFSHVGTGADGLPTTLIDTRLEKTCIDFLSRTGLVHSIVSEEAGLVRSSAKGLHRAVLDPLDGTSNAAMGFPYCALSLALEDDNGTVSALVANYGTGDLFEGFRGLGAFRNGKPIRVSAEIDLNVSRVVTSRPFSPEEAVLYGRLMTEAKRIRVVSCPSLDIAHVACGTFSACVDYHRPNGLIHTHDVIAAKLILEEAGGIMVNETGASMQLPDSVDATFNVFALNAPSSFDWVQSCFGLGNP